MIFNQIVVSKMSSSDVALNLTVVHFQLFAHLYA